MAEIEFNAEELAEHAQERFTKRIALSVAVYAVLLAVTALGGNNAMKEAMLSEMAASNTWAHFQAKSTREYVTKMTLERFEFDRSYLPKEAVDKSDATVERLKKDADRYGREKDEIQAEARAKGHERDLAMQRDPYFDYAEVLLQISIVLGSVAILGKSRMAYLVSIATAVGGTLLCLNGYTLLVKLPLLGY